LESGYSKPEKAAAVFADMSSYYRLCTSRPERIYSPCTGAAEAIRHREYRFSTSRIP